MNTSVSFPLAKLLNSIGFDKYCRSGYTKTGDRYFHQHEGIILCSGHVRNGESYYNGRYYTGGEFYCSAPTIAEVVMWLYEKHDIWVHAMMSFKEFTPYIQCDWNYKQDAIKEVLKFMEKRFNSPTEAYEAAIEYTLNNLI